MTVPDWNRELERSRNKYELTRLFTFFLAENCHDLLLIVLALIVSGGLDEKALRLTRESVFC